MGNKKRQVSLRTNITNETMDALLNLKNKSDGSVDDIIEEATEVYRFLQQSHESDLDFRIEDIRTPQEP